MSDSSLGFGRHALSGFAHHAFETRDFRRENAAAERREPVVAATRIFRVFASSDHNSLLRQALQVVVENAWSGLVAAFRLAGDLLHDRVSMQLFPGQREQDMQGGRGKREEGIDGILFHSDSVISDSDSQYKGLRQRVADFERLLAAVGF